LENGLSTDPVRAVFDGAAAYQVHFPLEDGSELILHPNVIEKAPIGVGIEGNEDVDVALGAKVFSQDRAEQRQLSDLPSLAEIGDAVFRESDLLYGHGGFSPSGDFYHTILPDDVGSGGFVGGFASDFGAEFQ
jgi:hypothetical protein